MTVVLAALLAALAACSKEVEEPEPLSGTEKAIAELQAQYDRIVGDGLDDPAKWASEDLENIGDWEYRIETFESTSAEEMQAALNVLGDDRWEVFWMERTSDGYQVFLKKPSVSYLSKIPLSQLGRFVIGDSGNAE